MKKEIKVFSTILAVIIPIIFISLYYVENNINNQKRIVTNLTYRLDPIDKNVEFPAFIESSERFEGIINFSSVHKEGWNIIWQDEFEKNELNTKKWHIENWAAEKNNELQFYNPKNVFIEDDHLKLETKKENYKGRDYTSGAIHSKDKFSFQYGKVEMRAKLPSGQGIFPAFWMMPNIDGTWLPEIDILEMLGHKPDEIWMVLHWLDNEGDLTNVSKKHTGSNYSQDFHTYGIEWSPEKITWFIDEKELFSTSKFIPNLEMYLYLNTAVGGDWPGNPDETTNFPQYFEVDYVRVYQKEG